ncbi:hypothetical protein BGX31_004662 [Mortierella sp. GBA43]|nr:hypothetical protein BGX31_004662 [Mortierella sp. GBA43]
MFTVKGDQITPLPRPGIIISPKAEPTFNYHSIRFIPRSHVKRLLQIHHYFEQVLELTTGYYAKIALVVALSSAGDIITVQKLFTSWQGRPQKEKRHYAEGSRTGGKSEAGGKEMYSAVIRGLVGRNFRDHERRPYYVSVDHKTGSRNNGVTQMHAALELFYDLLRKGGTPTFETYHSLVVGLAAFKNDMEAAELLLDHMIITKRKPYVQVLHVMCREYVRRKDYPRAERIFNMLREYGIRPKALTCNLMIRAVFRMSSLEALQYLGQTQGIHLNAAETTTAQVSEDLGTMARQLKRQRIRGILEYMQRNNTLPDQDTFSTLMYGYGHMEDGYPDLKETMVEMSREQYRIEPSLIVLNSLLFAHLNHGRVKIAESILDQMLSTPHPVKDRVAVTNRQPQQQESSPFRRSRQIVEEPEEWSDAAMDDEKNRSPRRAIYDNMMMIPGKGTFHALMLAHVERGDILGMERVLDKMIQAQKQQQEQQQELQIRHRSMPRALRRPIPPMIDLGGDEYTANIMLLGYLAQRDFAKVDMIQKQIQARPDWKSSSMFQDRQESRTQMIEFVRQQSSKAVVERSLRQNNDEDDPLISRTLTWISSESSTPSKKAGDPLIGDVEGELDDDIEIDVTTLSAKLRELMKSSSPTTTTTSTSTSSISSSQSSPPTSSAHE